MTEREKEIPELLKKELQKEDSEIIRLLRRELVRESKGKEDVLDKFMGNSVRELPRIVRAGDFLKAIFSGKTALDLQLMSMKMPVGEQLKLGGGIIGIGGLILALFLVIFNVEVGGFMFAASFILAFILFTIGVLISPDDPPKDSHSQTGKT